MESTHIRIDLETKEKLEKMAGGRSLTVFLRELANNGDGGPVALTLNDLAIQIGNSRAQVIKHIVELRKVLTKVNGGGK